jgi:uncharacterized DUF497 family protein
VRITFDTSKNAQNIRERDLPFALAAEFEFDTAYIEIDSRRDYAKYDISRLAGFGAGCTSCVSRRRRMAFA